MSHQVYITRRFYPIQEVVHAIRRIEIGGLNQHVAFLFAERKELPLAQSLIKQAIQHVLGRQTQLDRARISRLQLIQSPRQTLDGVGEILHDVRGKPHLTDSPLFVQAQHAQRLLHRASPIVDAGE